MEAALPAPTPAPNPLPGLRGWLAANWKPILGAVLGSLISAVAARYGIPIAPQIVTVDRATENPADRPPAAQLTPDTPIDYEGAPYEAPNFRHPDPLHAAGHAGPLEANGDGKKWPVKTIPYWIDFRGSEAIRPAVTREAVKASFRTAWTWWAEQVDVEPVEVPTEAEALVKHRFGPLDGASGTLAWSYLADGTTRPKEQMYDTAERWVFGPPASGQVSFPTVAAHEIGHVLALGHDDPQAPALMRPSYSASIPREQERDVARLVALGYGRRAPTAPPGGTNDLLSFPVKAKASDLAEALKKAGWGVKPPE